MNYANIPQQIRRKHFNMAGVCGDETSSSETGAALPRETKERSTPKPQPSSNKRATPVPSRRGSRSRTSN